MKIVHYDTDTQKVLGWYDKSIHKNIPIPNVEVSDEDWQKAIDTNANYVDVKNKTVSFKDFRTLEEIKTSKISEINGKCKQEIVSGFASSALGSEYIYQSEPVDQINLMGAVIAGEDSVFKCGKTNSDGIVTWDYIKHTIDQLKQVLADGKIHKLALLEKANKLKIEVKEATTVKDVEAIVW